MSDWLIDLAAGRTWRHRRRRLAIYAVAGVLAAAMVLIEIRMLT